MSGRLAITTDSRRTAWGACVVLCGLACGLLANFGGPAGAQPPKAPTRPEDVKKLDTKSPVPADRPGRASHEKFAIDAERKMFSQIEDFKPFAPEDKNKGEYDAYCEVVSHAKQFDTTDLEQHAARDLSVIELIKPVRTLFRTELLRFDGQLVCVRRLEPAKFFQDNPELGVKELYEARFVPLDESPLTPVSIVFLDLPEALAAVKQKPPGEWLTVESKTWIAAAGFYFKTMNVPGEQANRVVGVPVLIGKSVTPLSAGPVSVAAGDLTAIDPNIRVFKFIKDEAPMIRSAPTDAQWAEVAAENRVLMHAHRFPAAELEAHALPDVKFADLFLDVRTAYKLKIVRFEGRLISLRRTGSNADANPELRAAGINEVYEGWLVPANEPRGNPVCVLFTEPLEGVEPTGRVNKWVSFGGFYFKKMLYESQEQDPKNPGKYLNKYAPLLIGKSPIPRRDPDEPTSITWSAFVLWALGAGVALILAAGLLTWYYRGGDRKAKASMDAVRNRNPFDANAAPPPVQPSNDWAN